VINLVYGVYSGSLSMGLWLYLSGTLPLDCTVLRRPWCLDIELTVRHSRVRYREDLILISTVPDPDPRCLVLRITSQLYCTYSSIVAMHHPSEFDWFHFSFRSISRPSRSPGLTRYSTLQTAKLQGDTNLTYTTNCTQTPIYPIILYTLQTTVQNN
jgi:hypothetical protein